MIREMFQLRRLNVGCDSRAPSAGSDEEVILLLETTKIGRNPEAVDVVLTSTVHSNMISRVHSTIEARQEKGRIAYYLVDKSLNGTYINDYRAKDGPTELKPGDIIKFGHINGAAIKPGCHGPQHSAEFTFVFEKATHMRSPQRRPITIVGCARNSESSGLYSQGLAGDTRGLHSRFPLPTTTVELPGWQSAAAGSSPANPTFYNLQRFPGYYPTPFSNLGHHYLPNFWQAPAAAWQQQSAAVQQLQQQQLQQRQQQQQQQQQPSQQQKRHQGLTPQIERLADSSWMDPNGSTMNFASLNTQAVGNTVNPLQSSNVAVQQNMTTQQLTSLQAASGAATNAPSVPAFPSNLAPAVMPAGADLLTSAFAQRMYQQASNVPSSSASSNTASSSIAGSFNGGMMGELNSMPSAAQSACAVSLSGFCSQNDASRLKSSQISTTSTTDLATTSTKSEDVKRMECDSSVPSPPKSQPHYPSVKSQHLDQNIAVPLRANHPSASISSAIPSSVQASLPTTSPSAVPSSTSAIPFPSNARSPKLEEATQTTVSLQKGNMKDSSKKEKIPDPVESSCMGSTSLASHNVLSVAGTPSTTAASSVPRSRSPHNSPKRRGHGHSESSRSCSRSESPPAVNCCKPSPKRHRKSNEVARLLNDLTEGAWMRYARRSGKKKTASSSLTRGRHDTYQDEISSKSSHSSAESDSEYGQKRGKARTSKKKKNEEESISDPEVVERGTWSAGRAAARRNKKSQDRSVTVKKSKPLKKSVALSKVSNAAVINEDDGSEDDSFDEEKERPLVYHRGRKRKGTTRKKASSSSSDSSSVVGSSSSEYSESLSPPPRKRIITQRKVGTAPVSSSLQTTKGKQALTKKSKKRGRPVKRKASTAKRKAGAKRRKAASSSSEESSGIVLFLFLHA
ncbi:hypothetical protein AB6A40_006743 [Gnathostoma spinigerum]|uniref:FHA domain-containing protein n=1 Tax=Gnathostoma spinigerum TaxID=75299 RepID=A0ABD6EPE6_9BILA